MLAHDPYFIRDLRDELRKENNAAPVALFQLALAAGDYCSSSLWLPVITQVLPC